MLGCICWDVFGLCGNSVCWGGVRVCACTVGVYGVCADPGFYGMLCVCEVNFA